MRKKGSHNCSKNGRECFITVMFSLIEPYHCKGSSQSYHIAAHTKPLKRFLQNLEHSFSTATTLPQSLGIVQYLMLIIYTKITLKFQNTFLFQQWPLVYEAWPATLCMVVSRVRKIIIIISYTGHLHLTM